MQKDDDGSVPGLAIDRLPERAAFYDNGDGTRTEFDVAMFDGPDDELQADIYRRVLEICLRQPRCKALQSWGYTDRYSWRSNYQPLMLSDKYLAKPAYYEWQRVLRDF